MDNKQPTCEERIDTELEWELGKVRGALKGYSLYCNKCGEEWYSDDEYEECQECESDDVTAGDSRQAYAEGVLCVDEMHTVHRVQLSTGGPGDEFRVFISNGEITKIEYWFLDWYDGAHRTLSGDDFDAVSELLGNMFFFEELHYA